MFKYPVVFVDIETTGGSYRNSRVLEVAAVRYENGEVTAEYNSLINPNSYIPSMITALTGITQNDIADAPLFEDIADELSEIMAGAVFIAHNVRFDYSFLKNEFASVGIDFSPKLLCTVRLSRALYPDQKSHSLQTLIQRHSIPVLDRHRALADAQAILYFSQLAYDEHGQDMFESAIQRQLKTQYTPPNLDSDELIQIGDVPGVYIFKDENNQPLYIGKSIHLRKRVLSHFVAAKPSELKLSQQVFSVETIPTGSELAALIMESKLIKELSPFYNKQLRRVSLYTLLTKHQTDEYNWIHIHPGMIDKTTNLSLVYGLFGTRLKAKKYLEELARTFMLCPKLMGLEKTTGACFSYSLGKCKGACIGIENPDSYNIRFESALATTHLESWPYDGQIMIPINKDNDQVLLENWMVQGYINASGERLIDDQEQLFDLDLYKIIRRFVKDHSNTIVFCGKY